MRTKPRMMSGTISPLTTRKTVKSMMSSGRKRTQISYLCMIMKVKKVGWWKTIERGMVMEIRWPHSTHLDRRKEDRITLTLRVRRLTVMMKSSRGWLSLLRIKGREVNTEGCPVGMETTKGALWYHPRVGVTTRRWILRTKLTGRKLRLATITRVCNRQSTRRRAIMPVLLPTRSTSSLMRKPAGQPTSTTAMQVRGNLTWEKPSNGCKFDI